MDDRHRGLTVNGGDLALQDHVAHLPAPARYAVLELERREVDVALGVDGVVCPLVHREADSGVADDENGVERRETEHPAARRFGRSDEQAVVATGAQSADGAYREPAEPIRDEPLAGRRGVEVAAELGAESHLAGSVDRD